jgi:hypothetical protein
MGPLDSMVVAESSAMKNISLTGITAGVGEDQPLSVTATGSNPALMADLTVDYSSPASLGILSLRPMEYKHGSSLITVTVTDGGEDNDLSTGGDNKTASVSFTYTVDEVNDPTTLEPLNNLTITEDAAEQTVGLTGITAGPEETQSLRVSASSRNTTLINNPSVTYATAASTGSIKFTPIADQSGTATITVTVEDAGLDNDFDTAGDNASFSRSFDVTVTPVNDTPAFASPVDISIDEDAGEQTVNVTGITAGGGETQPLLLTAVSSNTDLIAAPTVVYTDGAETANVKFSSVANQIGTTTVTLTLEDGGLDQDLNTSADNASYSQSFEIIVTPVNDQPTIDAIDNLTVIDEFGVTTVDLAGITAGPLETQPLRVTATSSNGAVIANPTIVYSSPETTGQLKFTPLITQIGTTTLTVSVEDGGLDNNLSTTADNQTTTETFVVTVVRGNESPTLVPPSDISIAEDSGVHTVNLSGITAGDGETQDLRVTAVSANTSLISTPVVQYTSDESTGKLLFSPQADQYGVTTVTVTVEDGGSDNKLETSFDNLQTSRTFEVEVMPVNDAPTLGSLNDLAVDEDSLQQTVDLTGITTGGGEAQGLRITTTSNNVLLIPNPTVTYSSADSTGTIHFTPVADQSGTATVTVTVEDAGLDNDFSTAGDNATTTQTFTAAVNAVNDSPALNPLGDVSVEEDSAATLVELKGITAGSGESQVLRVTAVSADTELIATPQISYQSAEATGTLSFTPHANRWGTTLLTVKVEDGGLDNDLSTANDNGVYLEAMEVTVTAKNDQPTIDSVENLSITKNSGTQSVGLSGISAGPLESESLHISATSSNAGLIDEVTVNYQQEEPTATLEFTSKSDQLGTTIITVTVEDAGLDNDLATKNDNRTKATVFVVNVGVGGASPTLNTHADMTIAEDSGEATVNLTGITAGGDEAQHLRVTAVSANTNLISTPSVVYTSADSIGQLKFRPIADQSGTTTVTVTVEDAGEDNDLGTADDNLKIARTFEVTVTPVNDLPTLASLENVVIIEDYGVKTIDLSGIRAGANESQHLKVTATSDNSDLLETPVVEYTSASSTGKLKLTPKADQSGISTITVTVEDAGLDNDLSTTGDNATYSETFELTVSAVNDRPTLDTHADMTIVEDSGEATVNLTGITAGGGESQHLRVTAVSANTNLISTPTVLYTSADSIGQLKFRPIADQSGTTIVTVTVEDAGEDNDLNTSDDNLKIARTFEVTVTQVNDLPTLASLDDLTVSEDSGLFTMNLSEITAGGGETQILEVTATSDNSDLLETPVVQYSSANTSGKLTLTTKADQSGTATITVTVEDAGLDNDLSTTGDNATITRSFDFIVSPINDLPTLDALADITVEEDSDVKTINLSGITAGSGESQLLRVTAASDNTDLIGNPSVDYTSTSSNGTIAFTPSNGVTGVSVITVTVEDGGLDNDLNTTDDNGTYSQDFDFVVLPENPWHNPAKSTDVNNDGITTPLDALNIINYLNENGSVQLPMDRPSAEPPFYDVSKDGWVSPVDTIQIINELNVVLYTVTIGVQTTSADGQVIHEVEVGSIFYLTMTAEDHRDTAQGVFAAYADAYYDPNLITVVGAPQFIDPYVNVKNSDLSATGLIDEWGAVAGGDPTGSGANLVSRVPLRATAAGQVLFGTGAVDDQNLRAIAVYGSNDAVPTSEINYGAFNLKITDSEGEQGEGEAYFAKPITSATPDRVITAPAAVQQLLIDDALRSTAAASWTPRYEHDANEKENSWQDSLASVDAFFTDDTTED